MSAFKVGCHAFVVSELAAIVVGDGMNKVNKGREQFCNGITDRLSRPMNNPPGIDRVQRFSLSQCHQGALVLLADHGVAFPSRHSADGYQRRRGVHRSRPA